MSKKVRIFRKNGELVGYFLSPEVVTYQQGEYEIRGQFRLATDEVIQRLDFNPQSAPYQADLSEIEDVPHKRINLVYVQRGRQPVVMSGVAGAPLGIY